MWKRWREIKKPLMVAEGEEEEVVVVGDVVEVEEGAGGCKPY